jgi:hypothetical protein
MKSRRIICTLAGLLLLLTSPVAWGCESTDMASCQMAACPMSSGESPMPPCHEGFGAEQDLGSTSPTLGACCQAPLDREPIDSTPVSQLDLTSSLLPAGAAAEAPQERPATQANADTVASQRHELGRYTLLSSFLI